MHDEQGELTAGTHIHQKRCLTNSLTNLTDRIFHKCSCPFLLTLRYGFSGLFSLRLEQLSKKNESKRLENGAGYRDSNRPHSFCLSLLTVWFFSSALEQCLYATRQTHLFSS